MKRLYVIKVGTTFPETARRYGDFDAWTLRSLGPGDFESAVVDAEHGAPLPEPGSCAGVVITGSHAMVTDDLPWSVAVERWLSRLFEREVPILGICYGHQLLARALGGQVDYHPQGQEIGTVEVRRDPATRSEPDPLFDGQPEAFVVHATHSQSVRRLPPGAVHLAGNDYEANHAFRVGRCAWGVQFHPEYDAAIMRSYIEQQADRLTRRGIDAAALRDQVVETPRALRLLQEFAHYVDSPTEPGASRR